MTWAMPYIDNARVWAAPQLERTGVAVRDNVAPKVSSLLVTTARRLEKARPSAAAGRGCWARWRWWPPRVPLPRRWRCAVEPTRLATSPGTPCPAAPASVPRPRRKRATVTRPRPSQKSTASTGRPDKRQAGSPPYSGGAACLTTHGPVRPHYPGGTGPWHPLSLPGIAGASQQGSRHSHARREPSEFGNRSGTYLTDSRIHSTATTGRPGCAANPCGGRVLSGARYSAGPAAVLRVAALADRSRLRQLQAESSLCCSPSSSKRPQPWHARPGGG